MLSTIIGAVGGQLVDVLLGRITGLFESYFKKEISLEELRAGVLKSLLQTVSEVEKSHAETLAKTYATFMQAMVQSRLMQVVWASATLSQLFVLLWHQVGIPFIVFMGWTARYPSSGTTVEWSYLLLGACLGLGPLVLRGGPGALPVDRYKSLISK